MKGAGSASPSMATQADQANLSRTRCGTPASGLRPGSRRGSKQATLAIGGITGRRAVQVGLSVCPVQAISDKGCSLVKLGSGGDC